MRDIARLGFACVLSTSAIFALGCGAKVVVDGPGEGGGGGSGSGGTGGSGGGGVLCDYPGIDILISVDNSRGMADKQHFLAEAIPDLLNGLVNPPCVDANGNPAPVQPGGPLEACAAGTKRSFDPQTDIHIGVVSTSIGGHGSDSCPDKDVNSQQCAPQANLSNNDHAHFLARSNACAADDLPTYEKKGFLAWDPNQVLSPPGEPQLDNGMGGGLVPRLREMVKGAGEIGCGYESQLESVYRFLVDPNPYATISAVDNKATPMGTDDIVLQQRKEFLRPNSMLVVLMTSDENDCSTKEFGQFFLVNQLRIGNQNFRMPRARQECALNPNDPCCKSCGQSIGNCPVDPTCTNANGSPALYSDEEDDINVRCWDQKRRFGIDFLYPVDRYTQAFSATTIADAAGNLVDNPIFSDLDPNDGNTAVRNASLVLLANIGGVPWQDIAKDPKDAGQGFKSWKELTETVVGNATTWDVILGDPANFVPPLDPFMVESTAPRAGKNPITGADISPPFSPLGNPINGNEFTNLNDELQYACIFDLPKELVRDCKNGNFPVCDCAEQPNDRPLCDINPDGSGNTLQTRAKVNPSVRQLSVLKSLGPQSVLGSMCAAQTFNPGAADYGYRPSMRSILDWFSHRGC